MDTETIDPMKRRIKIIGLVIGCCLLAAGAHAEHVFEVGARGGIAGWNGSHTYVGTRVNAHAGAQFSYTWYSSRVVGLCIGATADMHRTGFAKNDYTDSYSTIDVEGKEMQIDYSIGSLNETYTSFSAGIPLQVAFFGNGWSFLVGPKVVFPLTTSWHEQADNAALSVYYPEIDNRIEESYPLAATRSFAMSNSGTAQRQKVEWWLAAELDYMLPLNTAPKHVSGLSFGIYFDYGFSTNTNSNTLHPTLISLSDTRDGFPLTRTIVSVMEAERQGKALVTNYRLFDVGIKISYFISPHPQYGGRKKACNCWP